MSPRLVRTPSDSVDFTALPQPGTAGEVILDVRRDDERAGGAIAGSLHIPLHSLLSHLDDVPAGRLWVHCAKGFRASIAASLLDRAGMDVVYIDDEYEHAVELGLATS